MSERAQVLNRRANELARTISHIADLDGHDLSLKAIGDIVGAIQEELAAPPVGVSPQPEEENDVVLRIEVFREDDGRFAAEFRSGDNKVGGMGEYSATPVGALANLCATLIKINEDDSLERRESPASLSPVEPPPPQETWFDRQAKSAAESVAQLPPWLGGPAKVEPTLEPPSDFTAPLPPRPPAVVKPFRYDLVRYGVTWQGQGNQPLLTPMPDGYWTPWHLAAEAPTGAPAPCVWRDIASAPKDGTVILVHGGIAYWYFTGKDSEGEWRTLTGVNYPGEAIRWPVTEWMPMPSFHPLTVER